MQIFLSLNQNHIGVKSVLGEIPLGEIMLGEIALGEIALGKDPFTFILEVKSQVVSIFWNAAP